ncbi:MAG TPA: GGDEF domain-containing protein [Tepidisphaeraceae bacterium]|nr:GGDEF domain-containing protein [Tepidisphaeraceae bacterium]
MSQRLEGKSLVWQIIALGGATLLFTTAAILAAVIPTGSDQLIGRVIAALISAGTVSLILLAFGASRLLQPIRRLRNELHHSVQKHDSSQQILAERTRTVDRLLEFSQTIQGVGRPDQIYATLSHFLRVELNLAGIILIDNDPEQSPSTQVKASYPASLVCPDKAVSEMDTALCPCLRQNLPRQFNSDGAPVRCAIDSCMTLDATHPAFCIPFNIGRRTQVLVHMLLPPAESWTESRRQLAQTYCNTACAALMSLHLLAEAEKQSMTDALTGLYNRRSMEQLMQREVALAERHGHSLSLVMIDLDNFKAINDSHGHAAGDYLLKSFADCVRITLRKTDMAFRYGGDEFLIALPQTPIAMAQQVVQKIRQAFSAVDFSDAITNLENRPTLSIGVAERSKGMNLLTLSAMLSAADTALYDAKAANRNCVRVYQPPQAA